MRHAAAATHAKDILLPEDTDGTSGRLLLLDMVALLLFMLGMRVGEAAAFVWDAMVGRASENACVAGFSF